MIRSTRGLITAFVLTLCLGLIIMFPARVAIGWFAPAEVPVSGIRGSIWNGSADEAAVNGLYLRDIRWHLHGLRLLIGKVSYRVEATPVAGFFESELSIAWNGAIALSDLTAALPLESFADLLGERGLRGGVNIVFERLEIVDGLATIADGKLEVANLIIPGVGPESLGGYKAEFFTQNNGVSASIEDTDGVLDLAGSLEIRKDRSFKFFALASAKPEAPQKLRQQLEQLPPANDRGQRELRQEGIL